MHFSIVTPTYHRPGGREEVARAIESVLAQSHEDWTLILVGDNYQPQEEFASLCALVPPGKLASINLPYAAERDAGLRGRALWLAGGTNALNIGLGLAAAAGATLVARLDDDDWWRTDHLSSLRDAYSLFPEALFVCTRGHDVRRATPRRPRSGIEEIEIAGGKICHSSTSWRFDLAPLLYVSGGDRGGDELQWRRLSAVAKQLGRPCVCNSAITCLRDRRNRNLKPTPALAVASSPSEVSSPASEAHS